MEDSGDKALRVGEKADDDQKGLQSLPLDLVLLIIAHLPSRQLFDLRHLCKAARRPALLALARRPFFIVQQKSPSPLCYLLPLDAPCSPLACSFKLAKSSFRIFSGSGNLLCLHRQYATLLDICVCDIFRRWKIVLPPIVHPGFAPHITRRVFIEDVNVQHIQVIGFHAAQPNINTDENGAFSCDFRIFAACNAYLRVFDSQVNEWSVPVYFPPYLFFSGRFKPPLGFATSDGNLILTVPHKVRVLFSYEDQSFEMMELASPHPEFEIAGYPASAELDSSLKLRVSLKRGLVLEGVCRRDLGYCGSDPVIMDGLHHRHVYSRTLRRSFCHAYNGKVYVLVMERDQMESEGGGGTHSKSSNSTSSSKSHDACISSLGLSTKRPSTSTSFEGREWHDLHTLDVEKCLHPEKGANFDCTDFFPARSPSKLTLYSAHIDTRDWTMKVSKEVDALACIDVFEKEGDKLSFISGCVHAAF